MPCRQREHYEEAVCNDFIGMEDPNRMDEDMVRTDEDMARVEEEMARMEKERANKEHKRANDQFFAAFFDDIPDIGSDEDDNIEPTPRTPRVCQWHEVEEHARTRLFPELHVNHLSVILLVLNLQAQHKATNGLVNDLFQLLHDLFLPIGNALPESRAAVKKVLSSIGMEFKQIHACVNDCILFGGRYKFWKRCLKCREPQCQNDMQSRKVPWKIVGWFPIILRLRHQFRCSKLAEDMVWHSTHRSDPNVEPRIMSLMVDSPLNAFVEERWPEFCMDPRHVGRGIGSDGVSPYALTGKARPYFVWLVVIVNYNLPPWKSMKKGHLMLTLIIPGPTQAKLPNTYLELLQKGLLKFGGFPVMMVDYLPVV